MLTIRLQRTGRTNLPTFRIVVAEHSKPVKGKSIEIVGLYLPKRNPVVFDIKSDRIVHWIKHGARPSDTIARLLKRSGFSDVDIEPFIKRYAKQKKKKVVEEVSSPPPNEAKPQEKNIPEKEENIDSEQKKE